MQTYRIDKDIKVVGMEVKTFPNGISQAFDTLMKILPGGERRSYYGISYLTPDNKVVYKVAAEEKHPDEAKQYKLENYLIEKGDYMAVTVKDWYSKLDSIKDIFHNMMRDKHTDNTKPCVEWYKSETEMLCLMKMAQ